MHSNRNNYDENDNYCLTSRRISMAPKLDLLDPLSFSEQESADFEEEKDKEVYGEKHITEAQFVEL